MLAKTRAGFRQFCSTIEANIFWVLYPMPCELLAFPSWLVVSHRYFFNPVWAQSIVAFSLSMHLFSGPQVVFYSASADSCSTNDSRRTQISGALCLQLSPLWYSVLQTLSTLTTPLSSLCPSSLDSTCFIPLPHLDMQPPLGKTLGKQRIHLVYLSLTYPSLIAWCPMSWKHLFCVFCLFCWCLGWRIILFHVTPS